MEFNDKHASINVTIADDLIIASFKGNLNKELLETFSHYLFKVVADFRGNPWRYISDSSNVQAATPEAELFMIEFSQHLQLTNCVNTAFVINSPIAAHQLQRILAKANRSEHAQQCIFPDLAQAKAFIYSHK